METTGYSVPNSGDQLLDASGTSSGPAEAVQPRTKIQLSDVIPAVPAVATAVAEREVLTIDSSGSDDASVVSSTERGLL